MSKTFDEEVSRTGACSPAHSMELALNALASCLLDDFRARLKDAGVAFDRSKGRYGPEFVLALPGLPTELVERIRTYSGTEPGVRMCYRYIMEALVHHPSHLEMQTDGTVEVTRDDIDHTQYVVIAGKSYVLDSARQVSLQGKGTYRSDTWEAAIRGVVGRLDSARRFEDAAKVLEIGNFFDEAGAERAKAPAAPTVGAELAQLVAAFQGSGIVSVYRCPSCGASIRFSQDTPTDRIQRCEYCGNVFQESDLADFLRTVLGPLTPPPKGTPTSPP